jgi:RimJ/RimL family protein N-acetyltransferase
MILLETDRLNLRHITLADAPFILDLVNQPSWLRFIGDHEVDNLDQARDYIIDGPQTMLAEYGFALNLVERKEDGVAMGLCGIVRRDALPEPDIGFAFLPQFCGQGYAHEAAAITLAYARVGLLLPRVWALTKPDNERSIKLLQRLGLEFVQGFKLEPEQTETQLYKITF